MSETDLKVKVLATARAMNGAGINRGTSGNVSVRHADGFLVTPTGIAYDACVAEDVAFVGLDGRVDGRRKPSSEWRIHRDIYAARPEAGAVIHAHSTFAVSLACMGLDIPPFNYMVARFGGRDVRCCDYATFGSQDLSDAVVTALAGRRACLMAHHGMVVFGDHLDQALALAVELETLCEQYWRVLQIGGPRLLSDDEMVRVLAKFADYGRQD
jgi:L-fuculose-phosphate aldolase